MNTSATCAPAPSFTPAPSFEVGLLGYDYNAWGDEYSSPRPWSRGQGGIVAEIQRAVWHANYGAGCHGGPLTVAVLSVGRGCHHRDIAVVQGDSVELVTRRVLRELRLAA